MIYISSPPMEKYSQFVVNAYSPPPRPHHGAGAGAGAGAEEGEDRLSALPDSLCHQIVSLLPATEARRTAFLSRRWRYIWCACPSFDFDEREFHGRPLPLLHRYHSRLNFIRFVDGAVDHRRRFFDDLSVDRFRVSIRFFEELAPHLDQWIAFALEKNVKELSVIAEMKDLIAIAEFFQPFRVPYELPAAVFAARSIQTLDLVFCDLRRVSAAAISLPLLKNLEMVNVHLNDSVLEEILSKCPLLEKISLSLVCGVKNLRISGENLKMAVVLKCSPLSNVTITAPNLESLLFRGKRHSLDKIDVSSCRNLRFLWLQRATNLTDDGLEKIIRRNPKLEVMILSHCSGLKDAFINSPKLWMLVMFKCKHLNSVKILAPSLTALEYSGHMVSFPAVAASAKLDAVIHVDGAEISSRWYGKLRDMCGKLEGCRKLWIKCEHDIDLIIPHDMRKRLLQPQPQLHGLKELKIHVRSGILNLAVLEDGIRWIFPGLRNLYVESDGFTHHFCYYGDVDVGRRRKFVTNSS
ncbi:putative F-box/FBD/LRR-repeat protein [Salvia divinorum]|uniref:F-box/FBD/LRR-repeat protein n=1 Tax=Salvia divinorum TaxID=28513 RepID=A0ABD1IA81_SALDI